MHIFNFLLAKWLFILFGPFNLYFTTISFSFSPPMSPFLFLSFFEIERKQSSKLQSSKLHSSKSQIQVLHSLNILGILFKVIPIMLALPICNFYVLGFWIFLSFEFFSNFFSFGLNLFTRSFCVNKVKEGRTVVVANVNSCLQKFGSLLHLHTFTIHEPIRKNVSSL